ncbi:MAG: hypothetical protein RL136_263 [Planctomycetota bacterium]|jgi:hypothetical protein
MKSSATSVTEYLASLAEDRRTGLEAVRKVILRNLDKDYEECMLYGMIGYAVPHRVWPSGYHCDPSKPLMMAALSSQKNAITVYLMSVYSDKSERAWFERAWAKSGKKLSMGGSCIRFRRVEDAALDVIGEAIRRMPAKAYLERYVNALASTGRGPDGKKLRKSPSEAAGTKKPVKAGATKSSRSGVRAAGSGGGTKSEGKGVTASKSAASKSTASKSTASKSTASKSTASKSTASKSTASKSTKPTSARPKSTKPKITKPKITTPTSTKPKSTNPGSGRSTAARAKSAKR